MTAFFIGTVRIRNSEKFQEYAAKAAKTFVPFGGKPVVRGKAEQALAGESDHHAVGIVSFPNMEALQGWYQSDEYQQLIPLRDSAAEMSLVAYSEPN